MTLEVDAYLKGRFGDRWCSVPGGRLGRYRSIFVGAPAFAVGQHVVVFLGARGPGLPYMLGLSQGVFRLVRDGDGWVVTPPARLPVAGSPVKIVRGDPAGGRCRWRSSSGTCASSPDPPDDAPVATSASLAIALALLAGAAPRCAYLKFGVRVNGQDVVLRWNMAPVRYFVTERGVPGVSPADFQAAVARAFATWQAVPTASIAYQFVGFTAALPGRRRRPVDARVPPEPELDRVLASTSFLVDDATGELLESDIFFNSRSSGRWRPEASRPRSTSESIALHEIGHLSGLGHSALGETELREAAAAASSRRRRSCSRSRSRRAASRGGPLRPDDIAGISDLYPENGFSDTTGSVSGRVTKNGAGIFGAHVVAFNPATGAMVGNFHARHVRARFRSRACRRGRTCSASSRWTTPEAALFFGDELAVDIDFKPAFHDTLVVVPAGGDSGAVDIPVVRK